MSAQLASSPHFPLPGAASPSTDVTTPPHCVTLSSHGGKTSSLHPFYLPTTLRSPPPRAETEILNLHHRRWPPSPDTATSTMYCYKKVISILVTLPATQSCLHFFSYLTRAPRHQSSTYCHRSLLLLSHAYRPSAQRHQ
jgi:hypothetical protein